MFGGLEFEILILFNACSSSRHDDDHAPNRASPFGKKSGPHFLSSTRAFTICLYTNLWQICLQMAVFLRRLVDKESRRLNFSEQIKYNSLSGKVFNGNQNAEEFLPSYLFCEHSHDASSYPRVDTSCTDSTNAFKKFILAVRYRPNMDCSSTLNITR